MLAQDCSISSDHRISCYCSRASLFEAVGMQANGQRARAKSEVILTNSIVGQLEVAHIRVPTVMNMREHGELADRNGALFASILLDGEGIFRQGRVTLTQKKHEIILWRIDSSFAYDFGPEALVVKISRNLFAYLHEEIQKIALPLSLNADLTLHAVLADLVKGAMAVDLTRDPAAILGVRLASSITNLLSAVVTSEIEKGWEHSRRRQTRLEKAESYIVANLSDENLSPEQIARHAAVSLRTLNRLFAQAGTTPMRWVWQQRLKASHSALVGGAGKNIADVAVQFGFSEMSHFSRSFKAVYRATPAQIANSRGAP